jgi:hypothetical protein
MMTFTSGPRARTSIPVIAEGPIERTQPTACSADGTADVGIMEPKAAEKAVEKKAGAEAAHEKAIPD